MKRVIAEISPFVTKQKVSVYEGTECINKIECNLSDIEHVCYILCKENDVHDLSIHGWQAIGEKIQKELNKSTEFSDFQININYV